MKIRIEKLIKIFFIILICSLGLYLLIYCFEDVSKIIKHPNILRDKIRSYGSLSFLVFIIIQIIQSVFLLFFPSQLITITGGYIFGPFLGAFFSYIGIFIGVSINYFIANKLGIKILFKITSEKYSKKVRKLFSLVDNNKVIFAVYLIPGVPKSLVPYICGISNYSYRNYLIYSSLGRLPVLLTNSFIGSNIYSENYVILVLLISIVLIAAIVGMTKGEAIMNKISKLHDHL